MLIDDTETNPGQDDTNPVTNSEEVAELEGEEAEAELGAEGEAEAEPQDPDEELEDFEHEGRQAKIPKWLKPLTMMQADYTRKTQEVAEHRKAAETRAAELAQRESAIREDMPEYATLHALDKSIQQYEQINFAQLQQQNPDQAAQLYRELQEMRHHAGRISYGLEQKRQQRMAEAERQHANRMMERDAALARDIPNWSKTIESKVKEFGIAQGLTPDEVESIADPRFIKILHSAMIGAELQAKAKAAVLKSKSPETPTAPTKTVTAKRSAPPAGLDDRLSTEEWIARRRAQLRARA